MKIIFLLFFSAIPFIVFAQEGEPKACPWGCPTLTMRGTIISYDRTALEIIDKIAAKMTQYPQCTVSIFTYPDKSLPSSKAACVRRAESIKNYLEQTKKVGLSRINIATRPGEGKVNNIDIKTDYKFEPGEAVKPAECPCEYPGLSFKPDETELSNELKSTLHATATKLIPFPDCKITIFSYPEASKHAQGRSEQRLYKVKKYLIEKENISEDRISTTSEVGGGEKNTLDIKCKSD